MAHFAQIDGNDRVLRVVVVNNDGMLDENGSESESLGAQICNDLIEPGRWVQCSYNNRFRAFYPGKGSLYDDVRDEFSEPPPFNSWQYDWENREWMPPIPEPKPTDTNGWVWDEQTLSWIPVPKVNVSSLG